MNNIRAIEKLNAAELAAGIAGHAGSWHDEFRASSLVYVGGLSFDLTEGDILCVFSQFGEILDINLVRDKETGKSRGFAFLKFEDQRSTDLTVDNFNGAKLLGRVLRVDHVKEYNRPDLDPDDPEAPRRRFFEDRFGGNAAPEIYGKSLAELERKYGNRRDEAAPAAVDEGSDGDDGEVSDPGLDPEDPMYQYLKQAKAELRAEERAKRKAKRDKKAKKKSSKHHKSSSSSSSKRERERARA
ncbi:RNA-binding protein Cwf29 [Blastocladiella emersonii ATCC 22665]|nr:RNA-binding protein Cwf29 [Blastocladiella emersonii ATCC 22665]